MVTSDASAILETITKQKEEQLKSITVTKDIDVDYDLGNLLVSDVNPLDSNQLRNNKDKYIKNLTRENTQLLFNEIWKLPIHHVQDAIVAKLPDPTTTLPREKRIPKPRPPTKWEQYAQLKGIRKRKRGAMVWNEEAKDWKPRFGYKRNKDDTKDWLIEIPDNADPYEDQFEKKTKAKRERIAKNELQRLRNIAKRTGKPIPGAGYVAGQKQSISDLESAFHVAKHSTASLGRFENKLKQEKEQRKTGKKRKLDLVGNVKTEQERQLKIIKEIASQGPRLNVTKAVNKHLHEESQSHEGRKSKGKQRAGKTNKTNNKKTVGRSQGKRRK